MKDKMEPPVYITVDRVIAIVGVVATVFAYVDKIVFGLVLWGLIGAVVIFFAILAHKLKIIHKKYRKELSLLEKQADQNEDVRKEFGYKKNGISKEVKEKVGKILRPMLKKMVICFLIAAVLCGIRPQYASAFWKNILKTVVTEDENSLSEENADIGKNTTEDFKEEGEEESESQSDPVYTERDEAWEFILDDPQKTVLLDSDIEAEVFFNSSTSEDLQRKVDLFLEELKNTRKENVDYQNIKDGLGKTFAQYSNDETEFINKICSTKDMYLEEWQNAAPHSSELDRYMLGRENINNIEYNGAKGCYDLWWKLANDHQRYAIQYELQTTNKSAVLFHYAMSIYCCMEALKYDISEKEYNDTFHYMVIRYQDIKRNESIIAIQYKESADAIYNILINEDPESNRY